MFRVKKQTKKNRVQNSVVIEEKRLLLTSYSTENESER